MKQSLLLLSLLFGYYSYGQDTLSERHSRKYIPLKIYQSRIGQVTDSTAIKYINGDTLVNVPMDFDLYEGQNVVRVKYEPKDSVFLDTYKDVVYNLDIKADSSARMRYWKDDIRIYFDESVPSGHAKYLMDFAEKISAGIDSLDISRNFIKEKSNYLVYYLNREHNIDYDPRITGNTGGYYISWNGKSQIYDGKLKINTETAKEEILQLNLLKYHFFKSLGHFKSSKDLDCKSILSPCRSFRVLTDADLEILKYHYSYGVCKGQNLKSFSDLVHNMQAKLEENPNAQLFIIHHE